MMGRIMGGEYDRHDFRIMGFHLTEFVAQELGLQYGLPGYQGLKKDSLPETSRGRWFEHGSIRFLNHILESHRYRKPPYRLAVVHGRECKAAAPLCQARVSLPGNMSK
jgi:hypothetical protein